MPRCAHAPLLRMLLSPLPLPSQHMPPPARMRAPPPASRRALPLRAPFHLYAPSSSRCRATSPSPLLHRAAAARHFAY